MPGNGWEPNGWGYYLMRPSRVYFRASDDRVVYYNPDAIWFKAKRGGIQVVIWEVEHHTNVKSLVGEYALASLIPTRFAEFYPWTGFEIGSKLRKPVGFQDTYDKRIAKIVFDPGERLRFYGDEITHLSFFMIVRNRGWSDYFNPYIGILTKRQRGKWKSFHFGYLVCSGGSRESIRRSLGKQLGNLL